MNVCRSTGRLLGNGWSPPQDHGKRQREAQEHEQRRLRHREAEDLESCIGAIAGGMENLGKYLGDSQAVEHVGKTGAAPRNQRRRKELKIRLIAGNPQSANGENGSGPEEDPLCPTMCRRQCCDEEDGCQCEVREALDDAQWARLDAEYVLDEVAHANESGAHHSEHKRHSGRSGQKVGEGFHECRIWVVPNRPGLRISTNGSYHAICSIWTMRPPGRYIVPAFGDENVKVTPPSLPIMAGMRYVQLTHCPPR